VGSRQPVPRLRRGGTGLERFPTALLGHSAADLDPEDRDDDEDRIVVSTREELAERVDQDVDPKEVDLHKDTVDDLTITDGDTTYTRVPDVFDVWLDSSVASWGR